MSALLLMFDDGPSPAFSANFMSGSLPAGLTYTNSGTTRTYFGSDGLLKTAVANEAIFEWLGGVFQGMRWEMEQRTNLATNSEGAAATWSVSNVVDAGTAITGFGASLAVGDNSSLRTAYKSVSVINAVTYTTSVFVVMDDGLAPVVGASSSAGDFGIVCAGALATNTATVTQISGSLYRVSSFRAATTTSSQVCGVAKFTTQSARTFRVTGIQIEAAASASSYIPTTSAAVTRQPDVLTATSISPWYRQDEGTVVFEGIQNDVAAAVARGYWMFNDGTNNNRIIGYSTSVNSNFRVVNATVEQALITIGVPTVGATFRHVAAYKANSFAAAFGGVLGTPDTSGTVPSITSLTLGSAGASAASPFMGYARRFQYFPTCLPDAQIQGMSRV